MKVEELMRRDVVTISPNASVADLVQTLADSRVSAVPVMNQTGSMIGVVSATDVLQAAAEQSDEKARSTMFDHVTVRDIMTAKPLVIAPLADAREAAQQMLYAEVRRLFVEENGRLIGVISQTDIAHAVGLGRL
jgi:CBS domain-containing protein